MSHKYTKEYIIEHAVALCVDCDYQEAMNMAYQDSIDDGYSEQDAEEIALQAMWQHGREVDENNL